MIFKSSEGVRIFTVKRVSVSFLKTKLQTVRTRSSRTRIAHAVAVAAVLVGLPFGSSRLFAQAAVVPEDTSVGNPGVLCQPQVVGNRRIPKDSVLARMSSHQGDPYDKATVERDFNSIWNTAYFENVRFERLDTPKCVQLIVYVREKLTIREINYKGTSSITQSDIQERFKKAKVGLTVESQYDPTRLKRGRGGAEGPALRARHQFATVKEDVKTIPPAAVSVTFIVKEGPTVKVGKIAFDGNENLSDRVLRNAIGEPEADRGPEVDRAGESVCANLRRQQAGRGYGAGATGLPGSRLLQGADERGADACARCGRHQPVYAASFDGQADRYP